MIVCINGSRELTNLKLVYAAMERAEKQGIIPSAIISGGARGVDTLAKQYAKENQLEFREFAADWARFGKSAGYMRNDEMRTKSDALVSIWDGKSSGTRHMIEQMLKCDKPVSVYLKTLHVVRLGGHPFILPNRVYDEYTAIEVHNISSMSEFPQIVRDENTKVAVVVPNIRHLPAVTRFYRTDTLSAVEAKWGYFVQKMQDVTNIDMRL